MEKDHFWLRRVVVKVNALHLEGIDFRTVWTWIFDWDESTTVTENFNTCRAEEQALTTLEQAGAIHTYHKENFMRDQNEESQALHGRSMWTGWDNADPALRQYDYIWYVDGFDYDKFMRFCEINGFSPIEKRIVLPPVQATGTQSAKNNTPNDSMAHAKGKYVAELFITGRELRLNFNGTTTTVKSFRSTEKGFRYSYGLIRQLIRRPNEWLGKDDLGTEFRTFASKVKDWPKLMGFGTELKHIFFSVSTKNQQIMLNPRKSLTSKEAEILQSVVNTLKLK